MAYKTLTPLEIEERLITLPNVIREKAGVYRDKLLDLENAKIKLTKAEAISYLEVSKINEKATVKTINSVVSQDVNVTTAQAELIKAKGELELAKIDLELAENQFASIRKLVNLKNLEFSDPNN